MLFSCLVLSSIRTYSFRGWQIYLETLLDSGVYAYTAVEGQVRIQYKWLVSTYVFPELKLHGLVVSKTEL
jgi:hypothetical protein